VVIDSVILGPGSWRGTNAFGKLRLLAGDRPTLRRTCSGRAAAYNKALCSRHPMPPLPGQRSRP
jgi:hypothetical protein